jgi:hypothetical protein
MYPPWRHESINAAIYIPMQVECYEMDRATAESTLGKKVHYHTTSQLYIYPRAPS